MVMPAVLHSETEGQVPPFGQALDGGRETGHFCRQGREGPISIHESM